VPNAERVARRDMKGDNVVIHRNHSNQDCDAVLLEFSLDTRLGPPSMHKLVAMWLLPVLILYVMHLES
jgi:hypothetical protein